MMKIGPPQRQNRIPGIRREKLSPCVIPAIAERIEDIASYHHVCKSFVEAVALAESLGIKEQEQFRRRSTFGGRRRRR